MISLSDIPAWNLDQNDRSNLLCLCLNNIKVVALVLLYDIFLVKFLDQNVVGSILANREAGWFFYLLRTMGLVDQNLLKH